MHNTMVCRVCLVTFGTDLKQHLRTTYRILLAALLVVTATFPGSAKETDGPPDLGPNVHPYTSRHLLMHTDLSAEQARDLLTSLEWTLHTVTEYWGRPAHQQIECYVVDDMAKWPNNAFPWPQARAVLRHIGGVIDIQPEGNGSKSGRKATVYATTQAGVAQHELVHAYCAQAFGRFGPEWYKEGMAEVATHQYRNVSGVECPPVLLRTLRTTKPKTISSIVHGESFTAPLSASVVRITEGKNGRLLKRYRAWRASDAQAVLTAKEAYYWSWALCYFLSNNPSYGDRFRALGQSYLRGEDASFDRAFADVAKKVNFEYGQFIRNLANGYRVDLCQWDWNKEFSAASVGDCRSVRIKAARGYQPSGLRVSVKETYELTATGSWCTDGKGTDLTANGDPHRQGRLVGMVVNGFEHGKPFDLGASGSFTVPSGGHLYLRCHDQWHQLNDNNGAMNVRVERIRTNGSPL